MSLISAGSISLDSTFNYLLFQALYKLLLKECMMLVLIIVCCRAARVVTGRLHDVVIDYLLLQTLYLLLMEDCLMLL
jgi:hypothetical protein